MQVSYQTNGLVRATHSTLRPIFDRWLDGLAPLLDNAHPQRRHTVRTEYDIAAVGQSIEEDPHESNRHRPQQLELVSFTLLKKVLFMQHVNFFSFKTIEHIKLLEC